MPRPDLRRLPVSGPMKGAHFGVVVAECPSVRPSTAAKPPINVYVHRRFRRTHQHIGGFAAPNRSSSTYRRFRRSPRRL